MSASQYFELELSVFVSNAFVLAAKVLESGASDTERDILEEPEIKWLRAHFDPKLAAALKMRKKLA